MNIKPITECAADIGKYYDNLMDITESSKSYGSYEHKKALWLALNAVNALEGVRFYVSFTCSWAFAELKNMQAFAISSGVPILFMGMDFATAFISFLDP